MHTFHGKNGTTIHFNSDGSGEAKIIVRDLFSEEVENGSKGILEIPCEDLIEFVFNKFLLNGIINKLEQISVAQFLDMLRKQ